MADTKISGATDGVTLNATDKFPIARSGLTTKLWTTATYIQTFLTGLANTWTSPQFFNSAAIQQKVVTANTGSAYTIDPANGSLFNLTMNSATPAMTLQTPVASVEQGVLVLLIQDGTGSRAPTFSGVTWVSGVAPTISSAIGSITYLSFVWNGTTCYGSALPPSTGTGAVVLAVSPTITTPVFSGTTTLGAGQIAFSRVVTAAGAVTVTAADYAVIINKASGAATTANLPAGVLNTIFIIKDGKGDAAANNITVTPAAGNIDGAGTYVINQNYGSVTLIYNGTSWSVL